MWKFVLENGPESQKSDLDFGVFPNQHQNIHPSTTSFIILLCHPQKKIRFCSGVHRDLLMSPRGCFVSISHSFSWCLFSDFQEHFRVLTLIIDTVSELNCCIQSRAGAFSTLVNNSWPTGRLRQIVNFIQSLHDFTVLHLRNVWKVSLPKNESCYISCSPSCCSKSITLMFILFLNSSFGAMGMYRDRNPCGFFIISSFVFRRWMKGLWVSKCGQNFGWTINLTEIHLRQPSKEFFMDHTKVNSELVSEAVGIWWSI